MNVTVCYGKNSTDIEFPCSECYLQSKLIKLEVSEMSEPEKRDS